MRAPLACLLLFSSTLLPAAWTPAEKPDAGAILDEARSDRMAGRYEDALAKHLWFHHEALKHAPAMYGVRASFALADWHSLADKYPPAMAALHKVREQAAADVVEGRNVANAFHDVASIDRELDQSAHTVLLFRSIESRDPALARRLAGAAQNALVESGDFVTAGRYVDPERELRFALEMRKDAERPPPVAMPGFDHAGMLQRLFDQRVGKTTALLVRSGRTAEARDFARKVIEAAPASRAALERALQGEMPEAVVSREQRGALRRMMP